MLKFPSHGGVTTTILTPITGKASGDFYYTIHIHGSLRGLRNEEDCYFDSDYCSGFYLCGGLSSTCRVNEGIPAGIIGGVMGVSLLDPAGCRGNAKRLTPGRPPNLQPPALQCCFSLRNTL